MAEVDANGLFAIDVDTENYADVAAHDSSNSVESTSRTFQSEEAFLAQKASYSAKIDTGNHYAELIKRVPCLARPSSEDGHVTGDDAPPGLDKEDSESKKFTLGKRDIMLLGYAVGEMYYDGKFAEVVELCGRVERRCVVDGRLGESLGRWRARCEGRLMSASPVRKPEESNGGNA
jgi:hypothetical protein